MLFDSCTMHDMHDKLECNTHRLLLSFDYPELRRVALFDLASGDDIDDSTYLSFSKMLRVVMSYAYALLAQPGKSMSSEVPILLPGCALLHLRRGQHDR